jgi:RNA polymerase sigma-70 factor (ECF subfamily)
VERPQCIPIEPSAHAPPPQRTFPPCLAQRPPAGPSKLESSEIFCIRNRTADVLLSEPMEDAIELGHSAVGTPELEFGTLVREHQAMVFSLAYHLLHDRAAAEEVAQDVFLELHRHLAELRSADHAIFWLRRVAANRAIDAARRRQNRREMGLDLISEPASPSLPSDVLLSRRLRRLVSSLPEKQRMLVILRYQEDMDPEEIAAVMKMPVNTVKSQLQRALKLLREKVDNLGGGQ